MASKSSKAFSKWRKRMGFTYRRTMAELDLCKAAVGYYTVGIRMDKKDGKHKAVEVPKAVLLACAAIEKEISPIE